MGSRFPPIAPVIETRRSSPASRPAAPRLAYARTGKSWGLPADQFAGPEHKSAFIAYAHRISPAYICTEQMGPGGGVPQRLPAGRLRSCPGDSHSNEAKPDRRRRLKGAGRAGFPALSRDALGGLRYGCADPGGLLVELRSTFRADSHRSHRRSGCLGRS